MATEKYQIIDGIVIEGELTELVRSDGRAERNNVIVDRCFDHDIEKYAIETYEATADNGHQGLVNEIVRLLDHGTVMSSQRSRISTHFCWLASESNSVNHATAFRGIRPPDAPPSIDITVPEQQSMADSFRW